MLATLVAPPLVHTHAQCHCGRDVSPTEDDDSYLRVRPRKPPPNNLQLRLGVSEESGKTGGASIFWCCFANVFASLRAFVLPKAV